MKELNVQRNMGKTSTDRRSYLGTTDQGFYIPGRDKGFRVASVSKSRAHKDCGRSVVYIFKESGCFEDSGWMLWINWAFLETDMIKF